MSDRAFFLHFNNTFEDMKEQPNIATSSLNKMKTDMTFGMYIGHWLAFVFIF
jgi:hypothetical protein